MLAHLLPVERSKVVVFEFHCYQTLNAAKVSRVQGDVLL
jgi:hypothetical protein